MHHRRTGAFPKVSRYFSISLQFAIEVAARSGYGSTFVTSCTIAARALRQSQAVYHRLSNSALNKGMKHTFESLLANIILLKLFRNGGDKSAKQLHTLIVCKALCSTFSMQSDLTLRVAFN